MTPQRFLFVDLETTGVDEDRDLILEFAGILTDLELNEVARYREVLGASGLDHIRGLMDDYVTRMHTENGLLDEVALASRNGRYSLDHNVTVWLREQTGSTGHVWLAGSGVAHFDRRFIKAQLPKLDKRLTYYAMDVGILRRACQVWAPDLPLPAPSKPHRAMDDIEGHLDEARYYKALLAGAMPPILEDPE